MPDEHENQDYQTLIPLEGIERIRRVVHQGQEYWSVIDVIGFLTDAAHPGKYWHTLRSRMHSEGARETLAQIIELPMKSGDGRHRKTDAMTRQTLLRLVQAIPSAKAEPFKLFLAQAGEEKITQMEQQADSVEELRQRYRRLGHKEEWITARILYLITRNAWTSEIQVRGVDDQQSIMRLTSLLHLHTFGLTTAQHKQFKGLSPRHNLADHNTRMELILRALGEETATGLHQKNESQGYREIEQDVKAAGDTAADARQAVERRLGEPVVSSQNFLDHPKLGKRNKPLPQTRTVEQGSLFDQEAEEESSMAQTSPGPPSHVKEGKQGMDRSKKRQPQSFEALSFPGEASDAAQTTPVPEVHRPS